MQRYWYQPHEQRIDDLLATFRACAVAAGRRGARWSAGLLADSLQTLGEVIGPLRVGRACMFGRRVVPMRDWQFGPEMPLLMGWRAALPQASLWAFEGRDWGQCDWRGLGRPLATFRVQPAAGADVERLAEAVRAAADATVSDAQVATAGTGGLTFNASREAMPVVAEALLRSLDGMQATSHVAFGGTLGQIEAVSASGRYLPSGPDMLPGLGEWSCGYALEPTLDSFLPANCMPRTAEQLVERVARVGRSGRVSMFRLRQELSAEDAGGSAGGYCVLHFHGGQMSLEVVADERNAELMQVLELHNVSRAAAR